MRDHGYFEIKQRGSAVTTATQGCGGWVAGFASKHTLLRLQRHVEASILLSLLDASILLLLISLLSRDKDGRKSEHGRKSGGG